MNWVKRNQMEVPRSVVKSNIGEIEKQMENVFSNTFFQIFKLRKVRCKLIVATIVFST